MPKSAPRFLENLAKLLTERDGRASNIWLIAFVLITVVAFGEAGYILTQNKKITELIGTNVWCRDRVQEMDKTLSSRCPNSSNSSSVVASDPQTLTSDIQSSNKPGWVKYHDETLGLSFEYPIDQIELKQFDSHGSPGIRDVSLISKKTKDLSGRYIELLTFSDAYNPRTYGDQNTPESIDPAKYTIQGKKYDAWNFVLGEGSACGGGNLKTATVKLRENLIIYKTNSNQQRNKDQKNCAGDQYDEFNTPKADLLLADKVISTVEFKE